LAVRTRLVGLYRRCLLPDTNQRSLKVLFEPFLKQQVFDVVPEPDMTRVEHQLQRKILNTPHTMNLIDILDKLTNTMYRSADDVKKDMEVMFENALDYGKLKDSAVSVANAIKARHKLWATIQFHGLIPDNSIVPNQCSRNLSCRLPDKHTKDCLYSWVGTCNFSSFKKAMQPTRSLTPSPPRKQPRLSMPPPPVPVIISTPRRPPPMPAVVPTQGQDKPTSTVTDPTWRQSTFDIKKWKDVHTPAPRLFSSPAPRLFSPPRSTQPAIPTHARLSEIVVWQRRHQFDIGILNALCAQITTNTMDVEWHNSLRIMEQAVVDGRLHRDIFLFSLLNCANRHVAMS